MRLLKLSLVILFLLLQYRLWFGFNGLNDYFARKESVERYLTANQKLERRNQLLSADVDDLKQGLEAIEERARNELGMIRKNETFFRIIPAEKN